MKELQSAEKAMRTAEAEVRKGAEASKATIGVEQSALSEARTSLRQARDDAAAAEAGAKASFDAKEQELRDLRNGQSPLVGFIGTYDDLIAAFNACDTLVLEVNDKRQVVHDAATVLRQAENDKLDLEIAAETADSAQERANAKLALNEADGKIQKRRAESADAQDLFVDSQRGLSRAESDVAKLQDEAARQRKSLDASDLTTMKVLDALKAYEKALVGKGAAIGALKAKEKELDRLLHTTDNPYSTYASAKKVYFEKRKARLEADRVVSVLEQNYLNNGGGTAAKEGIRRAKEVADDAKQVEKEHRETMNDAKGAVDREEKEAKSIVKDIKAAREELAKQTLLVAAEESKVSAAIEKARKAAGPEEEKRIKRVEEVAAASKLLKQEYETVFANAADAERKLKQNQAAMDQLTAHARELDKLLAHLDEAEVSRLTSELLAAAEAVRLKKTVGISDGDNLLFQADAFSKFADDDAMSESIPASLRMEFIGPITDWAQAVRTAKECAVRLSSAGSALSRELLR